MVSGRARAVSKRLPRERRNNGATSPLAPPAQAQEEHREGARGAQRMHARSTTAGRCRTVMWRRARQANLPGRQHPRPGRPGRRAGTTRRTWRRIESTRSAIPRLNWGEKDKEADGVGGGGGGGDGTREEEQRWMGLCARGWEKCGLSPIAWSCLPAHLLQSGPGWRLPWPRPGSSSCGDCCHLQLN